jgi:putative solute:sodium symporter small subunit
MPSEHAAQLRETYWRENRRWMLILGAVWFFVSLGCGVLWVEPLNQIQLGGFKLGFWFAQQGSIIVFILLIFVYARVMARLEKRLGLGESEA